MSLARRFLKKTVRRDSRRKQICEPSIFSDTLLEVDIKRLLKNNKDIDTLVSGIKKSKKLKNA
jgi:hypothetical protein